MCRTAHAIISVVICGIQMLVRVFMTFILMMENIFRLVLQTFYNFLSFMLQMASLLPICVVFLLTTRLKCFMCGGGGPCPVNRGGGCDCLMSLAAVVLIFFIFRAVGLMDKIFYRIGYVQAPPVPPKYGPTPGDITECSRDENATDSTTEMAWDSTELDLNNTDSDSDNYDSDNFKFRVGFETSLTNSDNIKISEDSYEFDPTTRTTTASNSQWYETETIMKIEYELKDTEIEPLLTEIYYLNDTVTEPSDIVLKTFTVNEASKEIHTPDFDPEIRRSISRVKTTRAVDIVTTANFDNDKITIDPTYFVATETNTNGMSNAQLTDVPDVTHTIPQTLSIELTTLESDGIKYGTEIYFRDVEGDTQANIQTVQKVMPSSHNLQAKKRRELIGTNEKHTSVAKTVLEDNIFQPTLFTKLQNEVREVIGTMSTNEEKSLQTLLQLFEYVTYA